MANIVFSMLPEIGHINASLKIAKTLKASGHKVYYLLLVEFEEYIRSHGLEFIPLFEKCFPKGYGFSHRLSTIENIKARMGDEAAASGVSFMAFWNEACQGVKDKVKSVNPHMLVQDLYALVDRDQLGIDIPWIQLNPTTLSILALAFGDPVAVASMSRAPTFILCPEEFDCPPPKRTPQEYYAEASIDLDRKEIEFQWDRIREDKRLIYCSLGTQSHWTYDGMAHETNLHIRKNFLQTVIDAVADNPNWQAVISLGNLMRAQDFHSIPSNVIVDAVSQVEVLKRASLMITHGGLNSVKECIFFGVPMVVFPLVGDQFNNANSVEYHGIGLKGNIKKASEGMIRSLINEVVTNPAFKLQAEKMKGIFRGAESEGRVVTIIESALAERQVQRSEMVYVDRLA
jgi:UDP:flavonoid glycosyltransferase YjiC (YdhE family)